jgi:hypothetical protein
LICRDFSHVSEALVKGSGVYQRSYFVMRSRRKMPFCRPFFFVRDVPERVISKEQAVGQRRAKRAPATSEKEHLAKHKSVTGVSNPGAS